MNVLDLFSGIGGFSLGLERAGMRTVAFCEIEPYCRAVLEKHWPGVPIFGDVKQVTKEFLDACSIPKIEIVCGGFPCQDISTAGKGKGLAGERSGLWFEFARIIEEIRPRYAIVENVSALRSRGLDQVLGSLAEIGYDAEWHCIPAAAVGAPHRRDRIWVVAYPRRIADESQRASRESSGAQRKDQGDRDQRQRLWAKTANSRENVADATRIFPRRQEQWPIGKRIGARSESKFIGSQWFTEPAMGELVDGVSGRLVRFDGRTSAGTKDRVAKLRALGNAVVPQIPEMIGRAIVAYEAANA